MFSSSSKHCWSIIFIRHQKTPAMTTTGGFKFNDWTKIDQNQSKCLFSIYFLIKRSHISNERHRHVNCCKTFGCIDVNTNWQFNYPKIYLATPTEVTDYLVKNREWGSSGDLRDFNFFLRKLEYKLYQKRFKDIV